MTEQTQLDGFGDTAVKLARNPLGVIALFIVLVYGVAGLVTAFGGELSASERLPLIYFLVVFPVIVLGAFMWLVIRHPDKLFGPGDFRDEKNYMRLAERTAAGATSLALASTSRAGPEGIGLQEDLDSVVADSVQQVAAAQRRAPAAQRCVLWVDDHPENNVHERRAFEAVGIQVQLATSTEEGLAAAARRSFDAVITDMGRGGGQREGYALLDELRRRGDRTPVFVYASSNAAEDREEWAAHGGNGCTNRPQELFRMITDAVRA